MSCNHNRGSFDLLFTFILGGIVGAGVALLYAPASGEETRKRIKDEADELGEKVKDGYELARDRVEEGVGKVREFMEGKKGAVKSAIKEGKSAIKKEKGGKEEEEPV
ncbi:MAG: YtxH domain-containing protein [Thermodesulfobacteriota bacterium]